MRGLAAFLFSVLALVWAGAAAADDPKTWGEATSGLTRADGFLPYYADAKGGRILAAFPKPDEDGISLRAIQATGLTAGLGSNPIGLDRGLCFSLAHDYLTIHNHALPAGLISMFPQ